jgi:DNA/RNA endonuclease YhcR with UshA esterase domain
MQTTIRYASGLAIVMAALLSTVARAGEPASSQPATTQPAQIVQATDTQALTALEGKTVAVHWKVARTGWSPHGTILFINFQGVNRSGFSAIVQKADEDAVKAFGDGAVELVGKEVTITGTLKMYRGKPEIDVTKAGQIEVSAAPTTRPAEAAPAAEPDRQ